MKIVQDECCHCGLPCKGDICPNRNVARYYCDKCKQEFYAEELYVDENEEEELCVDCLLLKYETVAQVEEREGFNEWR